MASEDYFSRDMLEDYLAGETVWVQTRDFCVHDEEIFMLCIQRDTATRKDIEIFLTFVNLLEDERYSLFTDDIKYDTFLIIEDGQCICIIYDPDENFTVRAKILLEFDHDDASIEAKKDIDVGLPHEIWGIVLLYSEALSVFDNLHEVYNRVLCGE